MLSRSFLQHYVLPLYTKWITQDPNSAAFIEFYNKLAPLEELEVALLAVSGSGFNDTQIISAVQQRLFDLSFLVEE